MKNIPWKSILYWGVIIVVLTFFYQRLGNLADMIKALAQGNLIYLALAVLVSVLSLFFLAQLHVRTYKTLEQKSEFWKVLLINLSFNFISTVGPTASAGGIYYYIDKIKHRLGISRDKAFVTFSFAILLQYVGAFSLFLLTIWTLEKDGIAVGAVLTAVTMMVLLSLVIISVFVALHRYPEKLIEIHQQNSILSKIVNGFLSKVKKDYTEEWFVERIKGVNISVSKLFHSGEYLLSNTVSGLMFHLINSVVLFCVCRAFGITISIDILLVSYSCIFLFTIVSPTPSGIGIVESVVPVIMISLGINESVAILIVLSYRAIVLWLPILLGFEAFRILEGRSLLLRYRLFENLLQPVAKNS